MSFPKLYDEPLPFTEKDLKRIQRENPLRYYDALRMRELAKAISKKNAVEINRYLSRLINRHFGTKTVKNGTEIFNAGLSAARRKLESNLELVPEQYQARFTSEGKVSFITDFAKLLIFWRDIEKTIRTNDNQLNRVREFEARRLIWLTILYTITMYTYENTREQNPIAIITEQLEKHFFASHIPFEEKTVVSWHDPNNFERVVYWHFEEDEPTRPTDGLIKKTTEIPCRTLIISGRQYLVFFDFREKQLENMVRKGIAKGILVPSLAAMDTYGLRLVFFDREAMREGIQHLFTHALPLPFTSWKLSDNTDGPEVGANRSVKSSAHFRALKFQTLIGGDWPEIIVQSIEDYINQKRGRGPESHRLYRARQLLDGLFQQLLPVSVYNVDWDDEDVRQAVFDTVLPPTQKG